jgi:Na+/H+ antiporter NhaD/arsenite permease-like protein
METGVACLLVFLVMALLMYSRKLSALLALPLMAITIALIARIPPADIVTKVLSDGALKLNATYTTTMFGAMLAELLNKQGIAKSLVRWVAEFAGDNPFVLGLVLTLTTAVLFSTLGGLGAVIMVGTIVLPVMLSLGIANVTAGSLFLFGISLGGMFNIASWALYIGVLGIQQAQIIAFVLPFALMISLIILGLLAIELKSWKNWKYITICLIVLAGAAYALYSSHSHGDAAAAATPVHINRRSIIWFAALLGVLSLNAIRRHRQDAQHNPGLALITPLVPLVLVLFFHWDFIPAFMAGIAYGALITWKKNSINVLTRSIIDGINTVIPAVCLMMGIGMLINAVGHDAVKKSMAPLLQAVIPVHALPYMIVFTIIAPLALYRGPLSLWGMGSGLVSLVQRSTTLGSQAIMGMLMSVGQIQGVCDPTNTANIWIATYLGTDTQILLRKTLPYAWTAVVCGLALAVYSGYVPF